MASETVLKKLYEVAKNSNVFSGKSPEDIWKACLAYKDRSDADIEVAMSNIKKKDLENAIKKDEAWEKLEKGRQRMHELQQMERDDRQQDARNAQKILEELFNK